jgi:hypothetical protein
VLSGVIFNVTVDDDAEKVLQRGVVAKLASSIEKLRPASRRLSQADKVLNPIYVHPSVL